MTGFDDLSQNLTERRRQHLYRQRRIMDSPQGPVVKVDGRELLNFCGNDYLGLANDPRVKAAFIRGVETWGAGAGASHMVNGHTRAHRELEDAFADFTGRPRALLFGSGFAANLGTLSALLGSGDQVFEDRLNHASLLDGGLASGARFARFAHADCADLDRRLNKAPEATRRLIVTDSVFSMDGDECPLDELVATARRHSAWLMVDDAHGIGVCGTGEGLVDPARYSCDDVQVLVGTLGKAFGTQGAFVAGSDALIETLIQHARTYIYSTAMPAAVAVASLESLRIIREEPEHRERLQANIQRFRSLAQPAGIPLMNSTSAIQPVLIGSDEAALAASEALETAGLMITAIRPPTVPKGTSRLRVTLTAAHTDEQINRLVSALADATKDPNG